MMRETMSGEDCDNTAHTNTQRCSCQINVLFQIINFHLPRAYTDIIWITTIYIYIY